MADSWSGEANVQNEPGVISSYQMAMKFLKMTRVQPKCKSHSEEALLAEDGL